jgi:peptide/nickel transport system ATP-binding protein
MNGCKFAGRCVYAKEICRSTPPNMLHLNPDHQVLCFKHSDYQAIPGKEPIGVHGISQSNKSNINL